MTSKDLEYSAQADFLPVMLFIIFWSPFNFIIWKAHLRDHIKLLFCVPQKNKGEFGWVNDDRPFIFGWTVPLSCDHMTMQYHTQPVGAPQDTAQQWSGWRLLYLETERLGRDSEQGPTLYLRHNRHPQTEMMNDRPTDKSWTPTQMINQWAVLGSEE